MYQLNRGFGQVTKHLSAHSNCWPQPCIQCRSKPKCHQGLRSTVRRRCTQQEQHSNTGQHTGLHLQGHGAQGYSTSPCPEGQCQGCVGSAAVGNPRSRVSRTEPSAPQLSTTHHRMRAQLKGICCMLGHVGGRAFIYLVYNPI